MKSRIGFTACAIALSLGTMPILAATGDVDQLQRACVKKVSRIYGYQCQGTADMGYGAGEATYVATVTGSDSGLFTGGGTLTTPTGTMHIDAIGQASFHDSTCFGHIHYQLSTHGQPIGTLDADVGAVHPGSAALGSPNAFNGVPGSVVMTCRLARAGRPD